MDLHKKNSISLGKLAEFEGNEISVNGWVLNKRSGKGIFFIILRDGTGFSQCIVSEDNVSSGTFEKAGSLTLESSVHITGTVVKDERQVGGYEIHVKDIEIYQVAEEYPIGKKEHGVDFLMDNRHLWLRSRRQWAIMKIRDQLIFSIREYFHENEFLLMDSPIFTGNAAEGTTTLFETDFYGQPAYLAQTGQLYGEAGAFAFKKIYTFGPTFRAEKSKTRRHLSEFWMIEPEMAFYDLEQTMDLIEDFLRYIIREVLEKCKPQLELLERDTTHLQLADQPFPRVEYQDAVAYLRGEKDVNGKNSIQMLEQDLEAIKIKISEIKDEIADKEQQISKGGIKKGKLNWLKEKVRQLKVEIKDLEEDERNIPQWIKSAKNFRFGNDLGGSDETVLTRLFDAPVMVYNWPKEIKAFYMKEADDPRFVKGVDVLAPEGYGEIIGGGERETDLKTLVEAIQTHKLPMEAFEWYLDLRRFGSAPHAGFGLGLERFVSWICKIDHVRESIPFARYLGRLFP